MDAHVKENLSERESPAAEPGQPLKGPPASGDVALSASTVDMRAAENFLLHSMTVVLEDAVKKATDVTEKVCEWRSPEQLKDLLDLELRDGGESESEILQRCRDAIRYSVKTTHPRFFNQLYGGMEPYSMVASFITDAIKTSAYTYEVAPVFTLMEEAVLRKMMEVIGWEEEGDGIFNPGGSISNMYAVNLARFQHCPDIKELGLCGAPRLVIFTSQECHYSISKSAALLGIGTKNVYVVAADERGKMIPAALEEQIQSAKREGAVPIMVNATAGTTVLGAFDPIDQIADICEKHNLWLHVDPVLIFSVFDLVDRAALWDILRICGIPNNLLDFIASRYTESLDAPIAALEKLREESECSGLLLSWIKTKNQAFNDFLESAIRSVSACWGGAALMSQQHKHLLKGIHRANSVAWNLHKMLMVCLQCCAFLVRDKTNLLHRCHSARASYLFQQDKFYDVSYDTGDKSVQCGRKPDAFKFWLMWKALGSRELGHRVDRALLMARYLAEEIKKKEGFRLVMEPEYANVCFWYIPPSLRKIPESPDFWKKLHSVAPVVKERMMKKGSMMISYQTHGDKANFFKMVIISPQVSREDMDFVLDEVHNLGRDL